jgi:hypothetical protein
LSRELNLIPRIIAQFGLDLSGFNVVTEAASGAYAANAVLAAKAGATVTAVTRSSRFASVYEVRGAVLDMAEAIGCLDTLTIVERLEDETIAAADIITNSGFVRPIDARMIALMKSTAVVPLMWETWEYRDGEVDLTACRAHDVLCLGTNESVPPLSMDPYAGILAMRNLFDLGLEVYRNRIVLIGQNRFCRRVHDYLLQAGAECIWFTDSLNDLAGEDTIKPLAECDAWLVQHGLVVDAILLAELVHGGMVMGPGGWLEPAKVARINPDLRIGIMAGLVDVQALDDAGLNFCPRQPAPAHYMTAQLYDIGPRPIMELFAAGLKVGERMAHARRQGLSVEASARKVLADPLAMDFEGDLSWV